MTSELLQIKQAYEMLQMTPEQIAIDRELDIAAVKAGLMQSSALYRKACGREELEEDDLNFSSQDLRDVNEVIKRTALYAEDERLRFQAAMYIRDDKKGRKEVIRQMGNQTFNILQFNEGLKAMKEGARAAKDRLLGQTVEV